MNSSVFDTEQPIVSYSPIAVLEQVINNRANGCLRVTANGIEWRLYFHQGQLTYGTHSVEPFERLERHLRRLGNNAPHLTSAVRNQVKTLFLTKEPQPNSSHQTQDYQAVWWLLQQQYLNKDEIGILIENLLKEVLEPYIVLKKLNTEFIPHIPIPLSHINGKNIIESCTERIVEWQKMSNYIQSPYQRPYLNEESKVTGSLPVLQREKLKKILIGFNFYQLGVLLNQDELTLAKNLYPLVSKRAIILKAPSQVFEQLPNLTTALEETPDPLVPAPVYQNPPTVNKENTGKPGVVPTTSARTNVVCVDDSPAMLKAITQFLSNKNIEIFTITDPLKALREIVRLQPKLILLDVGMPNLDGYRLCRLIRNHSLFKETPIVMVTGNTGVLDRAKAKVAGATDYLTKPFSQDELERMVQKYVAT
ncbi:MAG: Protein PatA [Chroococcopsis gigantea SAG 12.99]|jgi:chemotaxis family two-component system response regulator PixG|nr:response regulator [Chlorogloea purpurea SAG 13.99]MDV3000496.1 Protein PatA [Chroococcopsis gigantea SAG 12.99]